MRRRIKRLVSSNLFELAVALAITLSIGLLVPEICWPRNHPLQPSVDAAQNALTLVFAAELSLRFLASRRKSFFWRECWLDLLALVPTMRVFRFFRLLRLLRLYRLAGVVSRNGFVQRLLLGRASDNAGPACLCRQPPPGANALKSGLRAAALPASPGPCRSPAARPPPGRREIVGSPAPSLATPDFRGSLPGS